MTADKTAPKLVLQTERLRLRWLTEEDAEFMLGLINEPSFIRNIGDKGIRTVEGARQYLLSGAIDSYERHGYGSYLVELLEDGTPIGICGLVNRAALQEIDVGYAFLPAFWGKGYAVESAAAVLAYGRAALGIARIVAIVAADNASSIRVLEKIGLRFEKKVQLSSDAQEIDLFA